MKRAIGMGVLAVLLSTGSTVAQEVITKQYDDGGVYEGTFKDGKQHGTGTYRLPNGYVYEGEWVDGQRQGKGLATYADGTIYEGDFVAGLREGQGTISMPAEDGAERGFSYTGEWKAGEIHGSGVATYANGDVYEGNFVDGRREGAGVIRYATGDTAEGNWVGGALTEENLPEGTSDQ